MNGATGTTRAPPAREAVDDLLHGLVDAHRMGAGEVAAALGTDPRAGLDEGEARSRLERVGPNELAARPLVPAWRRFLAQFQDVLVILLVVATAISAGLWIVERDTALPYEAVAILAIVLLNAVMGYVQERRAESAVAALGAPALALGVDPAEEGLMHQPPRPPGEGVITGRMWRGIFFVGLVMAASTLFVLDASLPGGLVEGTGNLRYAQTMAFTTLMLAQLFNTVNARSDERSAFAHLFTNRWLWGAIALSLALQLLVLYVPMLQRAFGTMALGAGDWLRCVAAASMVLWAREAVKLVRRATRRA